MLIPTSPTVPESDAAVPLLSLAAFIVIAPSASIEPLESPRTSVSPLTSAPAPMNAAATAPSWKDSRSAIDSFLLVARMSTVLASRMSPSMRARTPPLISACANEALIAARPPLTPRTRASARFPTPWMFASTRIAPVLEICAVDPTVASTSALPETRAVATAPLTPTTDIWKIVAFAKTLFSANASTVMPADAATSPSSDALVAPETSAYGTKIETVTTPPPPPGVFASAWFVAFDDTLRLLPAMSRLAVLVTSAMVDRLFFAVATVMPIATPPAATLSVSATSVWLPVAFTSTLPWMSP